MSEQHFSDTSLKSRSQFLMQLHCMSNCTLAYLILRHLSLLNPSFSSFLSLNSFSASHSVT